MTGPGPGQGLGHGRIQRAEGVSQSVGIFVRWDGQVYFAPVRTEWDNEILLYQFTNQWFRIKFMVYQIRLHLILDQWNLESPFFMWLNLVTALRWKFDQRGIFPIDHSVMNKFRSTYLLHTVAWFHCETPLHPLKSTVWCGVGANAIIGPHFVQNEEGAAVTVNNVRYPHRLNTFWPKNAEVKPRHLMVLTGCCYVPYSQKWSCRLASKIVWFDAFRLFSLGIG